MKVLDFTSTRNQSAWRVLLLTMGDRWGRNDCFEVGVPERRGQDPKWYNKSRVAFYEHHPGFESDMQGGQEYQFVADYYLDTVLGLDKYGGGPLDLAKRGLDLVSHVPEWTLSADDMMRVLGWVLNVLPEDDWDVDKDTREELLVGLDQILEGVQ